MRLASRYALLVQIAFAILILPSAAGTPIRHLSEASSRDEVLQWIDGYRGHPDRTAMRVAMKVLSDRGALRDSDAAGVYVGFLAGVSGARPGEAYALQRPFGLRQFF